MERSDVLIFLIGIPVVVLLILLIYDYVRRRSETHQIIIDRDEEGRIVQVIEKWS